MFGRRINNTRIVSVRTKIVIVFSIFILVSSFSSNYINLMFNRSELFSLMNQLLTKDLKTIYSFCSNQYQIFQFDKKMDQSILSIEKKGFHELKNDKAIILGIKPTGEILFQSSKIKKYKNFTDTKSLAKINDSLNKTDKSGEGHLYFHFNNEEYFAMYKYNKNWKVFIVRGEEINEFYSKSRKIFWNISLIILGITLLLSVIGIFIIRYILRYIDLITNAIMRMVKTQEMTLIDVSKGTNDDVTYLGVAFNSLSSSIDNLISIFRKFANKDIVQKAYRDREIKLEGSKRELTILFTDIKSFTFITETLGTDIIKLLNMHYDNAIREIDKYNGVIGSIIGDALLAVFGAVEDTGNKSYESILAAFRVQDVTMELQERMANIKNKIKIEKGRLTPIENKVYKAVLLEVGVGIDGGEVFYGTLGSYVRMTNTVIGDTVNAASRLEGLTRVYKVPVICSEYVKNDVEDNMQDHGLRFVELDTVLVKGKTEGKKVYWVFSEKDMDEKLERQIIAFQSGLQLYYEGDWDLARQKFSKINLPMADEFKERTKNKRPRNWNGIWEMTTK